MYLHTDTNGDNRPELSLLRDFYDIVDNRFRTHHTYHRLTPRRYKLHMRCLYIVHPTFWSKAALWFFSTFTVSGAAAARAHILHHCHCRNQVQDHQH